MDNTKEGQCKKGAEVKTTIGRNGLLSNEHTGGREKGKGNRKHKTGKKGKPQSEKKRGKRGKGHVKSRDGRKNRKRRQKGHGERNEGDSETLKE